MDLQSCGAETGGQARNEVELEGTDESGKVVKGKAEFKGDSLIDRTTQRPSARRRA